MTSKVQHRGDRYTERDTSNFEKMTNTFRLNSIQPDTDKHVDPYGSDKVAYRVVRTKPVEKMTNTMKLNSIHIQPETYNDPYGSDKVAYSVVRTKPGTVKGTVKGGIKRKRQQLKSKKSISNKKRKTFRKKRTHCK